MRRREFIAGIGAGAGALVPLYAQAQQETLPKVGFLSGRFEAESAYLIQAFRAGLAERGYTEGQNLTVLYRWAAGDRNRLHEFVGELLGQQVAVIVTVGGGTVDALKALRNVPVVFLHGGDPVAARIVDSFNRPSGNITGVTVFNFDLEPKRLEIMKAMVPSAPIVVLMNPDDLDRGTAKVQEANIQAAAQRLGADVKVLLAATPREIDECFRQLNSLRAGGLMVSAGAFFNSRREQLIALSDHYAIPALYHTREIVLAGGLMSYGASIAGGYRQVGIYTGEILKGAKPAELPISLPTKFELAINLRTARSLGIEIPANLLALADEVIE